MTTANYKTTKTPESLNCLQFWLNKFFFLIIYIYIFTYSPPGLNNLLKLQLCLTLHRHWTWSLNTNVDSNLRPHLPAIWVFHSPPLYSFNSGVPPTHPWPTVQSEVLVVMLTNCALHYIIAQRKTVWAAIGFLSPASGLARQHWL